MSTRAQKKIKWKNKLLNETTTKKERKKERKTLHNSLRSPAAILTDIMPQPSPGGLTERLG